MDEILNTIGRFILEHLTFRATALIAIVIVILLAGISLAKRQRPPLVSLLHAGLAIIGVATTILATSVFLLTDPPAIKTLSSETIALIGFVVFFVGMYTGIDQVIVAAKTILTPPTSSTTRSVPNAKAPHRAE